MKQGCVKRLQTVRSQLWHSEQGTTVERIQRPAAAKRGGEEGGVKGWGLGDLGQRNSSVGHCNGVHMTLCICQNPQTCTTQRLNPDVNRGLWWITMCKDWLSRQQKQSTETLVRGRWERVPADGTEALCSIFRKPKTALKGKIYYIGKKKRASNNTLGKGKSCNDLCYKKTKRKNFS